MMFWWVVAVVFAFWFGFGLAAIMSVSHDDVDDGEAA